MEGILEPDLIICDPHHHLWDETYGNFGYRYMAEELFAALEACPFATREVVIDLAA